eukprot:TRINITY_DN47419_c0_g1_i1.p1 TRINITY_DN47419_c0_g1~~TRINITY_DN47419_c0_g1_i1.p1  ORF type:complete len:176 (+),score=12.89 TRINITY_DN47419_c0_g1_i1:63-530(+)
MGANQLCCSGDHNEGWDGMEAPQAPGSSDEEQVPDMSKKFWYHPASERQAAGSRSAPFEEQSAQLYTVTLDRSTGRHLGIALDYTEGATEILVGGVQPGGLVELWNTRNPACRVCQGDYITQVNGARGHSGRMLERCQLDLVLKLSLRRGVGNRQ